MTNVEGRREKCCMSGKGEKKDDCWCFVYWIKYLLHPKLWRMLLRWSARVGGEGIERHEGGYCYTTAYFYAFAVVLTGTGLERRCASDSPTKVFLWFNEDSVPASWAVPQKAAFLVAQREKQKANRNVGFVKFPSTSLHVCSCTCSITSVFARRISQHFICLKARKKEKRKERKKYRKVYGKPAQIH